MAGTLEVDVEAELRDWLAARLTDARVLTETPANLEQIARTLQVTRAGGPKRFAIARPRVVLSSFAIAGGGKSARENARAFAYEVDELMCWQLRGVQLGGRYVSRVEQTSGPTKADYRDELVRLFVATYSIAL